MGLALLDGERVVAPRRAIRCPAERNEHLNALREVADSGRYIKSAYAYNRLIGRNNRSAKLFVDGEADTRPPKSTVRLKLAACEIRQAVDIGPARYPTQPCAYAIEISAIMQ